MRRSHHQDEQRPSSQGCHNDAIPKWHLLLEEEFPDLVVKYYPRALYKPGIKVKLPEPGSKIAGLRVIDFGEKLQDEADNLIKNKK